MKKYSFERELRKCESPIEEFLMKKLYENGFQPYTQVPCGNYRIDIALYKPKKKLAIECDGVDFHSSPNQLVHDKSKDKYLEKNKWTVLRFTGKEIYGKSGQCIRKVKENI
jgi:very-short-patch-repair endonuclease